MSDKRQKAVKAAILGAALGVSVGQASASELLTVRPLGTGQSIRASVLGGSHTSPTRGLSGTTYAAHESKDGGEGKCGEGKCGEGKCGGEGHGDSSSSDKSGEGKCGEGKCGD